MSTSPLSSLRQLLALAGIAALAAGVLAGCASDSATDDPAPAAPTDAAPTAAPATSGPDPETTYTPLVTDDTPTSDARFGLTLQAAAEGLVDSFDNIDGFTIDGTTLTYQLNEGDAEGFDSMIDCISLGVIMDDSETLILEYPNGSVECD